MYWQIVDSSQQVQSYFLLAIEVASGKLDQANIWPRNHLDEMQLTTLNKLHDKSSNAPLPHWHEALQLTCISHQLLNGIDRIVWDFIISEELYYIRRYSSWGDLNL